MLNRLSAVLLSVLLGLGLAACEPAEPAAPPPQPDTASAAAPAPEPEPDRWPELETAIVAAEPEALSEDPFLRAAALHRWVTRQSDYALDADAKVHPFLSLSAAEMHFDVFALDKGGVYCGGHSVYLRKVMEGFGLEALTIDFGMSEPHVTHVTTVAAIDGGFYVYDATFGTAFERASRPADLDSLLSSEGGWAMTEIAAPERDFIGSYWHEGFCREGSRVDLEGRVRCAYAGPSYWRHYLGSYGGYQALPEDDSHLIGLMKRGVFSIGGGTPASRAVLEAMLRGHGIPFHAAAAEG